MKHLLITFSLLGILFLSGCDDFKKEEKETISFNDVVKTKNIYLKKFTQEPYTGLIETYYESGRLKETGEMIKGKKINDWITYEDKVKHLIIKEEKYKDNSYELIEYKNNKLYKHLFNYLQKRQNTISYSKFSKNTLQKYIFIDDSKTFFSMGNQELSSVPTFFCIMSFYERGVPKKIETYYLKQDDNPENKYNFLDILLRMPDDLVLMDKLNIYGKTKMWNIVDTYYEKNYEFPLKGDKRKAASNFSSSCLEKLEIYKNATNEEKEKRYQSFYTKLLGFSGISDDFTYNQSNDFLNIPLDVRIKNRIDFINKTK